MLLILSEYVAYSPYVQPVCLPQSNNAEFPSPGTIAYAVGWVKQIKLIIQIFYLIFFKQ